MKNHKSKLKIKLNSFWIFVLSFSILIFAFSINADAAVILEKLSDTTPKGDFVVGPAKVELNLDAGETKIVELTVTNRLGSDKTFVISEEDLTGSENPEQPVILLGDDRGPYSLKDYIRPSETSFNIPNGYRAKIPVTVSIPTGAEPGGLYGSLVVGMTAAGTKAESAGGTATTNALVSRIGTLFFVRVKGQARESGRLEGFALSGESTYVLDPADLAFSLVYRNDGNVSLNPYGVITVTNIIGSTVGVIQVEPWYALPRSLRYRQVKWRPAFMFGFYRATASINPGYGGDRDKLAVSFWVLPWRVIIVTLAGLLVIIALVKRFILKRSKNWKFKNQNEKL